MSAGGTACTPGSGNPALAEQNGRRDRMSESATRAYFWRDRRVFVTGGTGLIGGWLVQRLVDLGADVVALVRDWVPGSQLVSLGLESRVNVARGDVRDQAVL